MKTRHYWISNLGNTEDIACHMKSSGSSYTSKQMAAELAYERKTRNRLTVIRMMESQLRKTLLSEKQHNPHSVNELTGKQL
jgi:hypothetical protein